MSSASFAHDRQTLLIASRFTRVCQKARAGETTGTNCPAYRRLLTEAIALLGVEPPSVTQKKHVPPSGDWHDYFSLSIYFWPDPTSADGLPYQPRDGQPNPETEEYDHARFVLMLKSVEILTMAYAVSGEERFGAKAAMFLRIWFVDPSTRMNPNLLFAQYIPGENVVLPWKDYPARYVPGSGGRAGIFVSFGGVIEGHGLVPLTDCVRVLRGTVHWSAADDAAVCTWFRHFADWLLQHQHGLDEASCHNNHGSWYWAQVLSYLHLADEDDRVRELARQHFTERLQRQIEPDGSQPEELVRAISKTYTTFALCSLVDIAQVASRCGENLWLHETMDGRSLVKAMDWFLPYLTGQRPWTWTQIKPPEATMLVGMLCACAEGCDKPEYLAAIAQLPGLASDDINRLLYDV